MSPTLKLIYLNIADNKSITILSTISKIRLGIKCNDSTLLNISYYLDNSASDIQYDILPNIQDYIVNNENELFIYNLDKKIFCLNIFSPLNDS